MFFRGVSDDGNRMRVEIDVAPQEPGRIFFRSHLRLGWVLKPFDAPSQNNLSRKLWGAAKQTRARFRRIEIGWQQQS